MDISTFSKVAAKAGIVASVPALTAGETALASTTPKEMLAYLENGHKHNLEMIQHIRRVAADPSAHVQRWEKWVNPVTMYGSHHFCVRIISVNTPAATLVRDWQSREMGYLYLEDNFSVGFDWNITTFDKCVTMNDRIWEAAKKCVKTMPAKTAKEAMAALIHNLAKLALSLQSLQRLVTGEDSPPKGDCVTQRSAEFASMAQCLHKHGILSAVAPLMKSVVLRVLTQGSSSAEPEETGLAGTPSLAAIGVTAYHERQLRQWVGKARGMDTYKEPLTLQYQATRDGWEGDDFRTFCNGKGSMLFVIRSSDNYLFGGYTTVGFGTTDAAAEDASAFIFTLTNPHGIRPTKYRCGDPENAVFNWDAGEDWGLTFGDASDFDYGDIVLVSNCNTRKGSQISFPTTYDDSTDMGAETFTGSYDSWTVSEILGFVIR